MIMIIIAVAAFMLLGAVTYVLGDPSFCAAYCAFACAGGMIYVIVYITKIYREVHSIHTAIQEKQKEDSEK